VTHAIAPSFPLPSHIEAFRLALINWHDGNKRDYPWRDVSDPYLICLAEVLLQQTFADKVSQVYIKLANKFPKLDDFALADLEEVEKIIQPLGLQYRAKTLQNICKIILSDFKGKFPSSYNELLSIKGIGPYIASAICACAYNEPRPGADTNINRVIGRVFRINYLPRNALEIDMINKIMMCFLDKGNVRSLYYAILDFAALVCKFSSPSCESCSCKNFCSYYYDQNKIRCWVEVSNCDQRWIEKSSIEPMLTAPDSTLYRNMLWNVSPGDIVVTYITSHASKVNWRSAFVRLSTVSSYPYISSKKIKIDLLNPVELPNPPCLLDIQKLRKLMPIPIGIDFIVSRNMQKYLFRLTSSDLIWLISLNKENLENEKIKKYIKLMSRADENKY